MNAGHDVRVTGLADSGNTAVTDPDVGLDDSPVVDDDPRPCDGVGGTVGTNRQDCPIDSRSTFPPPNTASSPAGQATTAILGDLDEQIGVGQPDPVTGCRSNSAA